jgi:DNA-nicking Smr family endonuclease
MDDKPTVGIDDADLFRSSVGDVKPLHHDLHEQRRRPPAAAAHQRAKDEQRVIEEMRQAVLNPWELETGDELLFKAPGLQERVLRKLRRGQFVVGMEIDLHGMTTAIAKQAVTEFLTTARNAGHSCVRIVHGKGNGSRAKQPVLKGKLDHWLRLRKEVLAFCSARPVDGGTGAVYVLLKRSGA